MSKVQKSQPMNDIVGKRIHKNTVKNSVSANGELLLHGMIGDWWDDLDATTVFNDLNKLEGDTITVRIQSGGGYITEGLAIYNYLKESPKKVIIHIDGLAASMASVIAMAADVLIMPANALMMIHKPWVSTYGDADELRKEADTLDKMEESIVGIYQSKTGLDADVLAEMLREETWMNGSDCLEKGFCDEVTGDAQNSIDISKFNIPENLKLNFLNSADLTAQQTEVHTMPQAAIPAENPKPAEQEPQNTLTQADIDAAKNQAIETERKRVASLNDVALKAKLDATVVQNWIASGTTVEVAREEALNKLAERDNQAAPVNGRITHVHQDTSLLRKAMVGALLNRIDSSNKLDDESGQYRGMRLLDQMREYIDLTGGNSRGKSADEVIRMAMHSTGDFPAIIGDTVNRGLAASYKAAPRTFTAFAQKMNFTDFKAHSVVRIGSGQGLEEVAETGEIKNGSLNESAEQRRLKEHGRIFSFSRQLIINDDLGALRQFMMDAGNLAATLESNTVYNLLLSNPKLSDGVSVFNAKHNNLVAGSALNKDALSAMRMALRKTVGLDGETPLNLGLESLLVGPDLETDAEQLIYGINPNSTNEVNPFMGKLQLIVESRLSDSGFFGFADPAQIAAISYGYLEGNEEPTIDYQDGWSSMGLEMRVIHDFGAGFIDHRGVIKNPGA